MKVILSDLNCAFFSFRLLIARMFPFCFRRHRIKTRMLSCLLILSVLLTFWLVRQEVNKTERDEQSRGDQSVI